MGKITVTKEKGPTQSTQAACYYKRGAMSVNEAILNMLSQPHSAEGSGKEGLCIFSQHPVAKKES